MAQRLGVALVSAALASVLAVAGAPSTAAFSGITATGTYGDYGVPDNPEVGQEGARCFYNNGTGAGSVLKRVRVTPPVIWGSHVDSTWVGWRFKIMRSTNGGGTYDVYYKSAVWKDKANEVDFADEFVYENWYPSSAVPASHIKVQITLFWYQPGSSKTVEGKVVGMDDNYTYKFKGQDPTGTVPSCLTLEA